MGDSQHEEEQQIPVRVGPERSFSLSSPGSAKGAGEITSDDRGVSPANQSAAMIDALVGFTSQSPIALGVFDGASDALLLGNQPLHELFRLAPAPGTPCNIGDSLPPECVTQIIAILGRVEQSRQSVESAEIEFRSDYVSPPVAEFDQRAPADAPGSDTFHWRLAAWPVPAWERRRGMNIMIQVSDFTQECRGREERARMISELRQVNSRLIMATLREEDLKIQAQAAATAKTNFLATMSHELRTPLSAIIGYEELLANRISGPISDLQGQQLARIKSSAIHLLDLINDVLTLARTEAGQETVTLDKVPVGELVRSALSLVEPLAHSKGLEFEARVYESSALIATDELKVRQILVNLLGNAVKFTESGSVCLDASIVDGDVVFSVTDSGIGVAPENTERIFDSFWQINQSPSRRVGGSGLGLSVSRRLARLLGGDIVLQSQLGKGSRFTVRIPVAPPQQQVAETAALRA